MFTLRERFYFMDENRIVVQAIEQLKAQTGLLGTWRPLKEIDGQLDLTLDGKKIHFYVEVKNELRHYQLPHLNEIAKQYKPLMIIANRIFPTLKEILREKKIGYLDTAGNVYINTGGNFIWVDGKKTIDDPKPVTNRAFTKTGLKTVFYLLLHEDAINMPHRKLADITGVALGNIKNVIEGLKDAGFILQINEKMMQLQNKRALLDRWITGYKETLKPTLHIDSFRFLNDDKLKNWINLPFGQGETVWGSEPAAEHFTNYLRPEILTIYTNQQRATIIPKWKLIPDEKGNVQVYKKFWKDEFTETLPFAPPLLVYADLLLTDDPRCIETAEMIYKKYLENEFGKYTRR